MAKGISRFFVEGKSFKKEFRRQARMLIVFTLGFTIAFTWRQTIFDLSLSLVKLVTNIQNSAELSLLASIIITLFSLIFIFFTAHWLKEDNHSF